MRRKNETYDVLRTKFNRYEFAVKEAILFLTKPLLEYNSWMENDDISNNIYALENLLMNENRTFFKATSGDDGLKLALSKSIDLIILDVQMPEMDGFEVAHMLKSNKRTKDIPILFASASF